MSRDAGMSILRMVAVIGGVGILFMCVLTAGVTFMPGTKIGRPFGASAKALAGENVDGNGPFIPRAPEVAAAAGSPDAGPGTGADAGSMAASPAGQGGTAPAEAQVLPEQQAR
jgi:hypothetical protein